MGVGIGAMFAASILLAGYVYADAARRGMPATAWTAIALLIPNGVGFVLYFLLRKSMLQACCGCGCGVSSEAAFCPVCGARQMKSEGLA